MAVMSFQFKRFGGGDETHWRRPRLWPRVSFLSEIGRLLGPLAPPHPTPYPAPPTLPSEELLVHSGSSPTSVGSFKA